MNTCPATPAGAGEVFAGGFAAAPEACPAGAAATGLATGLEVFPAGAAATDLATRRSRLASLRYLVRTV